MSRWDAQLEAALDRRDAVGLRRRALPVAGGLLNVCSNDYLGLSRHPALAARAAEFAARYGAGATASRLICGTLAPHAAIEARVAAMKGKEAAMLLATGWQANTAVLAALLRQAGSGVQVFSDALNHASLIDGIKAGLRGTRPHIFRHNDLAHLKTLLQAAPDGPRMIVTESVFSMDGDRADIPALRDLAVDYDAFLYVDEAHATGVLGPCGAGLCAEVDGVDLVMGTFGKALGSAGAYVTGSRILIDWLQNECGGFIYTTAPPPPVLGAIEAALDLVPDMDADRARVLAHAENLRQFLRHIGIETGGSTQIVPAIIGDAEQALRVAADLRAQGILAIAIRPPTVPAGTSRIRLALSAAHGDADMARLKAALSASFAQIREAA